MKTDEEARRCPFCGRRPAVSATVNRRAAYRLHVAIACEYEKCHVGPRYYDFTREESLNGLEKLRRMAIKRWNRRAKDV